MEARRGVTTQARDATKWGPGRDGKEGQLTQAGRRSITAIYHLSPCCVGDAVGYTMRVPLRISSCTIICLLPCLSIRYFRGVPAPRSRGSHRFFFCCLISIFTIYPQNHFYL